MRRLEVGRSVGGRKAISNLSQTPKRVTMAGRGAPLITSTRIDLPDQKTQLPTQLDCARRFGYRKSPIEQFAPLEVVLAELQEDLSDRDRSAKEDQHGASTLSPHSKLKQPCQVELGILLSKCQELHFDLDPR